MRLLKKPHILKKLPEICFIFSLCAFMMLYGMAAFRYQLFPYAFLKKAKQGMNALLASSSPKKEKEWYYRKTTATATIPIYEKNAAYPGLSLVTSIVKNDTLSIRIIDMDGTVIHEWPIDWFRIWTDATHISPEEKPQSRPGTHLHGAVLLETGDLIFNFEHLGMVRLNACGDVVWRLPYRTHHAIYRDEDDVLWVPGQKNHKTPLPAFPNYIPPFIEPIILKISLDGNILAEISVLELLQENGLQGLLYLSTINNVQTKVSRDTLHLNDVETFPRTKKQGFVKAGDIMISLRNINTILIFSEADRKITYLNTGEFVRQHDPDFLDGNTISVFDNNNIALENYGHHSRIVIHSLLDTSSSVYYTGNKERRFYTNIMGKHQWLPNGNLLITESVNGRAFEVDKSGHIVWEFVNLIEPGYAGIVEEVERLPVQYTPELIKQTVRACKQNR